MYVSRVKKENQKKNKEGLSGLNKFHRNGIFYSQRLAESKKMREGFGIFRRRLGVNWSAITVASRGYVENNCCVM